ncbi:SusC/RagA family TonB-linked outer membrane protein [Niastella koreensis]|uniref:TonB-dependent receptor n=3 Tax=Niastella koreensis TaxID=354356 RepID=G8T8E4_NIAKG|nr:SusC/RagA family TonB-linked outer membrane protein [Niastella koreensis]AEV99114.1 TonB-dependent receptor [Niastella koreensis GR20-10]OQP44118.1 SusC/RagA family TonB-linked outer membrane protein [Niastella koreensis]
MQNYKRLLLLICLTAPVWVFAQINVSGTVVDSKNNPIQFASVKIKNSNAGTSTDASGKFSLTIPGKGGVLDVTFVGYKATSANVSAPTTDLVITMQEDVGHLEEVVVTGLASSTKRANVAHAVGVVSAKQLVGTTPQATVDAALYGKFPGATISSNSGAPGGGISIKLRGITSLVGNSQPLFIVDGVYYDNSSINSGQNFISKAANQGSTNFQENPSNRIADLDPEDIERIEILKGASTAAIYGARASTGVVIVTTKKGKSGKPRIELGQSIGWQMQLRKLGMRTWDTAKVRATYGASGLTLYNANGGKTYNYEDELYGVHGFMNNTRVAVSGGSDKTSYYAGMTYQDNQGIVKHTGYRKTSFRVNLDQAVTKFLDLSVNANYVESNADRGYFNNDNTGTSMGVAYVSTPSWVSLYPDANGNYPNNPLGPSNWMQTRDLSKHNETVNRMLLGGRATWKVIKNNMHDLKIIALGGIDYYTLNTKEIFPQVLQFEKNGNGTNGALLYGTTVTRNDNYSALAVYELNPNNGMIFTTQAGVNAINNNLNTIVNTATQLIGTQTNIDQAGAIQVEENRIISKDRGFFAQEEVNYKDMVIGTVGIRGDKSSRNGNADKLYYYPKFSLAFNATSLLDVKALSLLKVRGAYGEAGNFAPFGAIYSPLVPINFNGTTGSIVDVTRGDANLKPEKQKELELGLDAGVLNNRISVEFTWYKKDVEDLILKVQVPTSTGFSTGWQNVAAIQNHGVEIGLNAVPVLTKDLRWNAQLNWWKNTAKVTRLDVPAFNVGAFGASLGTYRIEKGKSPTQIVGIGDANDKVDPLTNLATFGNAEPDFNLSFNNNVTWKNFELNVLMHWKQHGDNINLSSLLSDFGGTSADYDKKSLDPKGILVNGDYRIASFGHTARPFVEDASYFRVREIGLSYTFPKELFKDIARVKIGFSGRNLINVFKYNSYDPEVSNFGIDAISSNVEVTPFPSSKSFHFNVSVTF